MPQACQFAFHYALTSVGGGILSTPDGTYQYSAWATDLVDQVLDFRGGPQAPGMIATSGTGYLLVAWPEADAAFVEWSVRVRLSDGVATESCHFQFGSVDCVPA